MWMHDTNFYKKQLQKLKIHYKKGMYWAIPEKKTGGGGREGKLRIWNFQRYQRKSMWNFQVLIKNEVESNFLEWPTRKVWNFQGSWFLALEFPRNLTLFYGISRAGALFSLDLLVIKKKIQGFFNKVCPQPPFWFFME